VNRRASGKPGHPLWVIHVISNERKRLPLVPRFRTYRRVALRLLSIYTDLTAWCAGNKVGLYKIDQSGPRWSGSGPNLASVLQEDRKSAAFAIQTACGLA
jgi:hypothetical protein